MQISSSTRTLGLWSAVLATIFSIAYVLAQLAEWFGYFGSSGGPESASTAMGLVWLLTPSLLLAPSFLILIVSAYQLATPDRKIWGQIAIAFATMYASLISIVYFVQLTFVVPRLIQQRIEDIEVFLFKPFDSFLYSVDILGYSFMCAAMLFAAQILPDIGTGRWVRRFLFANGMLIPFLLFQTYFHGLIWIAALWSVTFPAATWSLALLFRRMPVGNSQTSQVGN